MGSFSVVCCSSNQVIKPGALCRLFVVGQACGYQPLVLSDQRGDSHTLSQATTKGGGAGIYWSPLSFGILAQYQDYGSFSLLSSPGNYRALLSVLNHLLRYALITPKGDHHHDVAFDLRGFLPGCPGVVTFLSAKREHTDDEVLDLGDELVRVWAYLVKGLYHNRAAYFDHLHHQHRPLALAVMHEHAVHVMKQIASERRDFTGRSYEVKDFLSFVQDQASADLAAHDRTLSPTADDSVEAMVASFAVKSAVNDALSSASRIGNLEMWIVRDHLDGQTLRELSMPGDLEFEKMPRMQPILEHLYVLMAMNDMNLTFSPLVTAVMDDGTEPGSRFASFVRRTSDMVCRDDAEASYGPLTAFQALFKGVTEGDALIVRAWSLHTAVCDVEPIDDQDGLLKLSFKMSASFEQAKEILTELGFDTAAVSLVEVK